ncbi:OprD family outer membrane porin [Sulfurospirillum sp. 1612]|uniref:OprD family outer membrane porin n=1 Tax=Sulfurospirillum sp. 1612 TaxID=3094835 RepID=UPI002F92A64C
MKLAKLSLAAITVASLSASAFAADSLAGMFKEGTVNGTLSAYYFSKSGQTPTSNALYGGATYDSASILDFGLDLTYKTASFNGFSAGATVQSTHSPFANDEAKTMYNGDMYGSGEVFSEAYIQYDNSGFMFKAGRMYLGTPLVASSGSRITKDSFEGYLLGYTGLPDTTLVAGYITKWQDRTDGAGNMGTFVNVNTALSTGSDSNGAYTLYAVNKSVPGLTLQAQWAQVVDAVDLYYVQADYAGKTDSFTYALAGQFQITDYDASGVKDSGYYGLKANVGMDAFGLTVAYSKIDSDNDAGIGLGNGPDPIFTAGTINCGDDYTADEKAYLVQLDYAFNKATNFNVYYVKAETPDSTSTTDDYDAYGAGADYQFDGALKGLGLVAQYEVKSFSEGTNADDKRFRFKATYAF